MYLSLNGTLVAGGKLAWPEFARLAARLGYGGVDVSLGPAMKDGAKATRALLDELRLQPAVLGFPVEFRKDDAAFQEGMKRLPETADFAAAIGCPRMATWLMSSSETPKAELRKLYLERFQSAAAVLARSKVRLALEFLGPLHLRKRFPHEFIWRMEEMVGFAKDCGPNVGVMLDSWHWHHSGGSLADILAAGKSRIVHVQIADSPDLPPDKILDSERLMPGEGIIDFVAFFGALKKIGYDDGVSPEVFGRGLKTMPPEQGAKLGLETSRNVMRKAGVL